MVSDRYNLIVTGTDEWLSNVLKHPYGEDAWIWMPPSRMPTGIEDYNELTRLPTILMPEKKAEVRSRAYLIRMSNIRGQYRRRDGNGIAFDYSRLCKPIDAEDVVGQVMNTIDQNFTRWYVKKGDLIGDLVRALERQAMSDKPSFFGLQEWPLEKLGHVAVMMPYSKPFDTVYQTIESACSQVDREPKRVKDVLSTQPIIADVFCTIVQSEVIICDITGLNPNVLYEAGIAHARNIPVILITQDAGDPTFNLSQTQVTHYLPNEQGLSDLKEELVRRIKFFAN